MAQAFVIRNDLQNETTENPVRVVASYRNDQIVDRDWHGPQCTVVSVSDSKIVMKPPPDEGMLILISTWREDYLPTVNAEAQRRITDAFPIYKQNNYNAIYNQNQSQHGTDTTTWPDQAFVAEYSRGWQYISDVRTVANSFTAMPVDPTDDSIWPTAISPVA
jgi:hypothetical protein